MSCLGKLFLSILNTRLTIYALEHRLLSKSALGFVAGNRCSDAHIIQNLVKKFCQGKVLRFTAALLILRRLLIQFQEISS